MEYKLLQVQSIVSDAQFVGGEVIVHVGGKNIVIGRLLADEVVAMNDAGDELMTAPAPAPATPARAKKDKAAATPAADENPFAGE